MPCLGAPGAAAVEVSRDDGRRPRWIKAKQWAARYLAHPEMKKLSVDFGDIDMANALFRSGYTRQARLIFEKLTQKLVTNYRNYSALEYYLSKETLVSYLEYFRSILSTKNVSSDLLDKAIEDINK